MSLHRKSRGTRPRNASTSIEVVDPVAFTFSCLYVVTDASNLMYESTEMVGDGGVAGRTVCDSTNGVDTMAALLAGNALGFDGGGLALTTDLSGEPVVGL